MSDTQLSQQTEMGELLTVLTDERCRELVSFFQNYSSDSASVEMLASVLYDRNDGGQKRFAAGLHHVTLPKLAETGIVTYDPDRKVVEYRGHSELNQLQGLLEVL